MTNVLGDVIIALLLVVSPLGYRARRATVYAHSARFVSIEGTILGVRAVLPGRW